MPRLLDPKKKKPHKGAEKGRRNLHVTLSVSLNEYQWLLRQASQSGEQLAPWLRRMGLAACPGYDPTRSPTQALKGQRAIPGSGVPDVE